MPRQKYLVIFGTRPEAIKMAPVIQALKSNPNADCVVCFTGQHQELVQPILELFQIIPDLQLRLMSHDQQLCGLTALLLTELEKVIVRERPDWVVVQGDTTSAMAASMAAFYLKTRVAHVEAGLRSQNNCEPFPEEINRKIIDMVADLHFAATSLDKQALIREGFRPEMIHVTGNTVIDSLLYVASLPFCFEDSELRDLPTGSKRILLVTAHRRENQGAPLRSLCKAIKYVAERYRDDAHIVIPVHPNPNVCQDVHHWLGGLSNLTLKRSLGYQELVNLAKVSYLVLTDSGGLQEELPSLGKPVLVLRKVTERRGPILAGAARLVGVDTQIIVNAVSELMDDASLYREMARRRDLFGDGKAGMRIARILAATQPESEEVSPLLKVA
jgi:UDP-N-acetylglucosamine 2-epimerase (non-hydrolysing)